MNTSRSFCASAPTRTIPTYLPTEADQIIVIEATGLQGAWRKGRGREGGTKVSNRAETIGLLELLPLDREKISKLNRTEIFRYEPIPDA